MAKVSESLAIVCLAGALTCVGCGKTRSTALDVNITDSFASTRPTTAPAPATRPIATPATRALTPPPATRPATTPTLPRSDERPSSPTTQIAATTQAALPATAPASQPSPTTSPAPTTQPATPTTTQAARDRKITLAVDSAIQEFRQQMDQGNTGAAVDPLITLADRVRSIAVLRLPVATLCSKVDGFGVYEPLEARLRANRETSVVLYCELTGFHSRQGDRAMWETRVSQDVVLLDEKSQEIWKDSAPAVVDQCRNLRRDFYVARILRFPATVAPGQYSLKIMMTDQLSHELVESTLPVEFLAE